jgi:hypothetical protein
MFPYCSLASLPSEPALGTVFWRKNRVVHSLAVLVLPFPERAPEPGYTTAIRRDSTLSSGFLRQRKKVTYGKLMKIDDYLPIFKAVIEKCVVPFGTGTVGYFD